MGAGGWVGSEGHLKMIPAQSTHLGVCFRGGIFSSIRPNASDVCGHSFHTSLRSCVLSVVFTPSESISEVV